MSEKSILTSGELQSAMDIIHMAFEQPQSILDSVNKKPMVTLFLLQHLTSSATDAASKERLLNEAKFVRDAVAASSLGVTKQ